MDRKAKDGGKGTLKRRHLGLAGLATVLIQYSVGVRQDDRTERLFREVAQVELQKVHQKIEDQANVLRLEREREYVKKPDLELSLKRLEASVNKVGDHVEGLHSQVNRIEGYLKGHPGFGAAESRGAREVSKR